MKIDSDRLDREIKSGLKPLYLLHGDAPLLIQEAADSIREAAKRAGYLERELLIVEQGFDWGRLNEAANSLSLFCEQKFVDLRIGSGKPGVEGAKALQAYCAKLSPEVVTLITTPKLDRQSMTAKWFEAIENAGVVVSCNSVERGRLPQWIAARLARQNQQCDPDTLDFLAGRIEGNLIAAHQEIQKLGLLLPPGTISFEQAKQAVLDVARFDIFQLGEAMLMGDAARFARILDGLRGEGTAEPLVLWQVSEETRTLYKVLRGEQSGKSPEQALKDARVWGPRQSLVGQAKRRTSLARLRAMLRHAGKIDKMIKGLEQGDVWDELLQLGLKFAAKRQTG